MMGGVKEERDKRKLVTVDGRKRISLHGLADHERYLIHKEEDGTIVLVPAVVTPVTPATFVGTEAAAARIDQLRERWGTAKMTEEG